MSASRLHLLCPTSGPLRARCHRRAFTLTELLVVMAIILIILGAVVPALKGPLDGINLTGSADNVTSVFSLARQTAMARNLSVEVRLYKQDATLGRADWTTFALVIPSLVNPSKIDEWIGSPTRLSGNVIVDPGKSTQGGANDAGFSTLITLATNAAPTASAPSSTAPWTATESTNAPFALRGLTYVAFRFLPDGSTSLPALDGSSQRYHWCLSLRNYNTPSVAGGATPATNFISLVLDPYTGRMLLFHP